MGTEVVRYDIYGNDVYIANKMESNGKPGSICVSQKTKELLENKYMDDFIFDFNKEVFLQNVKMKVQSFFLIRKKAESVLQCNLNNSAKTPLRKKR